MIDIRHHKDSIQQGNMGSIMSRLSFTVDKELKMGILVIGW